MFLRSIILATCLSLSIGCVYRLDVQQGNEITSDMVAQLKPGMSKREVIKVLGFPLINDPFNANRWDYYYSLKSGKTRKVVSQQSATLIFDGDSLQSIDTNLEDGNSAS